MQVDFADIRGELYFSTKDNINGGELWKSDGIAAGTVMVQEVNVSAGNLVPFRLTDVGDNLFLLRLMV